MQQFRIRPNGFAEIKKKTLLLSIPVIIAAGGAGIYISIYNTKGPASTNMLPVVIPVMIAVLAFSVVRGLRRKKALVDSYTIIIDQNLITRQQLNTPALTIYFNDIVSIVKRGDGYIIVKGKNMHDVIYVLPQMENIETIEKILNAVSPVKKSPVNSFLQAFRVLLALLAAGLIMAVYMSSNKLLVGISALILVPLLIWTFIRMVTSKNMDSRTKRRLWVYPVVLIQLLPLPS